MSSSMLCRNIEIKIYSEILVLLFFTIVKLG